MATIGERRYSWAEPFAKFELYGPLSRTQKLNRNLRPLVFFPIPHLSKALGESSIIVINTCAASRNEAVVLVVKQKETNEYHASQTYKRKSIVRSFDG